MRIAIAYLLGALTASSYWAAAMWGVRENHPGEGLWVMCVILTIATVFLAIAIALKEKS